MAQQASLSLVLPAAAVVILTGFLTYLFAKKRIESSVNALDWLVALFGSVALLGIVQILKYYFPDWSIFVPDTAPRGLDIVTVLNLVTLLILYFMSESFLAERPNPIRLSGLTVLVTLFFSLALYYQSTGDVILTSDILKFAQDSTFDAFIFDVIQVSVLILVTYTFYIQYSMSDNEQVKQFLLILLIAIFLFLVTATIELFEHFLEIGDVSAFLVSIPTFLILAYFYLRHANFIYLAPANIAFLQIVSQDGQLLYAAELTEELNTNDFLVAPSLTSVSSIISELVNQESSQIVLKQFVYDGGYILFEEVGDLRAILQTDRPSQILKRSMRYFLREFYRLYHDQLENYKGYIEENNGVSPDDLFIQAIPIVMSRQMSSSFDNKDAKAT